MEGGRCETGQRLAADVGHSDAVLSFLLSPLTALAQFLWQFLQPTCQWIHEACGLPEPADGGYGVYFYTHLVHEGRLGLKGHLKAGGINCEVAVLLTPRRRILDRLGRQHA